MKIEHVDLDRDGGVSPGDEFEVAIDYRTNEGYERARRILELLETGEPEIVVSDGE